MIKHQCNNCSWWNPSDNKCNNLIFPDFKFFDKCDNWEKHECRCGGMLELRQHNNKKFYYCYSCHFEFNIIEE